MIKIPYNCIECEYVVHEGICGIYSDRVFMLNLDRGPPEACPLKHINRFEWLCNKAIKETVENPSIDTSVYSYKLELPLTVNNSVLDTIDYKMNS